VEQRGEASRRIVLRSEAKGGGKDFFFSFADCIHTDII
jgi:hypothetical protein